ncbi:hypothetical protein [Psychromicrobium lacuslunae]|uniref:Uncharacterized protein n=1 Tax=Psychromicrobium lacuslunae TaxID=1618207 RepID=A0A0D4BW44_9MICC|nr:hypothetical protein [Psychromicrobium lacuslunae]AJT40677.1 hypothetical protein UM93_02515 [Psychromicrobium lacuslunae]
MDKPPADDQHVQIEELGINGLPLSPAPPSSDLPQRWLNPWLIALWIFEGLLIVASIICFNAVLQTNDFYGSEAAISIPGQTGGNQRPWFVAVSGLLVPAATSAAIVLAATLIVHIFRADALRRISR